MIKILSASSVVLALFLSSTSYAAAQLVTGKCTASFGNTPTSYTAPTEEGAESEYCFGNECFKQPVFSNSTGEVLFRVGGGGATILIFKRGNDLRMNWRSGDRSFDSTSLKCD